MVILITGIIETLTIGQEYMISTHYINMAEQSVPQFTAAVNGHHEGSLNSTKMESGQAALMSVNRPYLSK